MLPPYIILDFKSLFHISVDKTKIHRKKTDPEMTMKAGVSSLASAQEVLPLPHHWPCRNWAQRSQLQS